MYVLSPEYLVPAGIFGKGVADSAKKWYNNLTTIYYCKEDDF